MSTPCCCTKFVLLLPRSMLTCAWSPLNSRCGPATVTESGAVARDAMTYPAGGRCVMIGLTAMVAESKTSSSALTLWGGSTSSMFGSLLATEIGTDCTPGLVTAFQLTFTVSADVLKALSLSLAAPMRTATSGTGCTSTNFAGMALRCWGTGTVTTRVVGGLLAYTTPTQVTSATTVHPTFSLKLRVMNPGKVTVESGARVCAACSCATADAACPT